MTLTGRRTSSGRQNDIPVEHLEVLVTEESIHIVNDYEIVQSPVDYHESVIAYVGDYQLDPIYEAKCREFLREGDVLWVVGRRVLD